MFSAVRTGVVLGMLCAGTLLAQDVEPADPLSVLMQLVADGESRAPGQEGNRALETSLMARFAASGFPSGALTFEAPVFKPGKTRLTLATGDAIALLPMHPTLMRPGNFDEDRFDAPVVYLGRGEYADLARLKGVDLQGAIGVLEFDCGERWMRFLRFGVRGFVFLGAANYSYRDAATKVYATEVAVPRFFVETDQASRLRDAARAEEQASASIEAEPSRWESTNLRCPWVLIPGSDATRASEVIALTAPLDANSVVPELATGAQSAINLHLLLSLLDLYERVPPQRSVLLCTVNAHTQNFQGERVLAWHTATPRPNVEAVRDLLARQMRISQVYVDNYRKLKLEPVTLPAAKLQAGVAMLAALTAAVDPLTPVDWDAYDDDDLRAAIDAAAPDYAKTDKVTDVVEDPQTGPAAVRAALGELRDGSADERTRVATACRSVFEDERLLTDWRKRVDVSAGPRLPVKGMLQDQVKRRVNEIKQFIMAVSENDALDEEERTTLLAESNAERHLLTRVLVIFNRYDIGIGRRPVRYRDIAWNAEQRSFLAGVRDEIVAEQSVLMQRFRERLELDMTNDALRDALGARKLALVINLEMQLNGDQIGFCSLGNNRSAGNWARRFGLLAADLAGTVDAPQPSPFIDALTGVGGHTEDYYFTSWVTPAAVFYSGEGMPALALKTAFAGPGAAFTPADRVLDPKAMARQTAWLTQYLPALIDHPDLTLKRTFEDLAFSWSDRIWTTMLGTFALDELSGKTQPDQKIVGSRVVCYEMDPDWQPLAGDVVRAQLAITDVSGYALLLGMNSRWSIEPLAYQLDAHERQVLFAVDKGRLQSSGQMMSAFHYDSLRTVPMFPCVEFPLLDRVDPSLLHINPVTVQTVWPQGAAARSPPQKFGAHGLSSQTVSSHKTDGPAAIYLWRKDTRFKSDRLLLVTSRFRCALNATPDEPEGEGFGSAEELGNDFFGQVAKDMLEMNRGRYAQMTGVANELVDDFIDEGAQALTQMQSASAENAHTDYLQAMFTALGSQTKAYSQLRAMNADMLKAIICYMALMIPFCFFLQKLLFNFTRLEHELLVFVLMFTSIYLVFRFVHPAFALAMNAEAIFIAFLLGAIGSFITWVLHAKFQAQMQMLFRGVAGIGDDIAYGVVGQTAAMVGVSNMKRRRVRTLITTATIVLVVFTMLAFSSISKRVHPTLIRKSDEAPYTGILFHWPGGRPMDEASLGVLESLFADRAELIVRRVLTPAAFAPETSPAFGLGWRRAAEHARLDLKAVVGLPMQDASFLGQFPLVAGRYFESADAREIILPATAAAGLGLTVDDVGHAQLDLLGESLLLVGLVDDARYRLMRDLNPYLPLLPFRSIERVASVAAPTRDSAGDEDRGGDPINTSALALIPAGLAQGFGAAPFTVSLRFDEAMAAESGRLWAEAECLLTATQARFYMGSRRPFHMKAGDTRTANQGVYYVGSSFRTSIGGLSRLIVPLSIAGLLIFNTMLGSVYERRSEIAVYNAIGLNPTHIFIFFVAEALVYGVIGSVSGYLIGQVLAIGIKTFGLIEGISVNFSSLMVVYVILFTIALVLASTIFPAVVAARTAAPSGKRKWALPGHDGTRMHVELPFIYEPALATGVMHYIYGFLDDCRESSLGDVVATLQEKLIGRDDAGRHTYTLSYTIALAPFDLGVTQNVRFDARFDELVDSYRVNTEITRISGQDTNWVTTNEPFLEKLRKFLIRWRNMDGTQHGYHVEQGTKLFGES
ncbi:MAG: FtsX-like permease family protein [Verrucomicrobia bacterium]|nr:FtsX-like permease family protein [Verrucomicrobiota bacterium]